MKITQTQIEEQQLVARLVRGDEDAFSELYARYKNQLLYFGMQFLKSKEHTEDIFQDTFYMIWQNRKYLNPNLSFSSYLYTCFRNRIFNELRELSYDQQYREYILSHAVDAHNGVEEQINYSQMDELLNKALNCLTSRQKQIFLLSRNQHLSNKEIAEQLNLSVYTVQEHISTSLKVLRGSIGKESDKILDLIFLLFLFPF